MGSQRSQAETHRLLNLASPKEAYEAPNIFMHSDFRGLIHAD